MPRRSQASGSFHQRWRGYKRHDRCCHSGASLTTLCYAYQEKGRRELCTQHPPLRGHRQCNWHRRWAGYRCRTGRSRSHCAPRHPSDIGAPIAMPPKPENRPTSSSPQPIAPQDIRVHHVDGSSSSVREDLVEDVRELEFIFFPRHVADVWCADDVVHRSSGCVVSLNRLARTRRRPPSRPAVRAQTRGRRVQSVPPGSCYEQAWASFARGPGGDHPSRRPHQAHVQRNDVARPKNAPWTAHRSRPLGALSRRLALHQHVHAKGPPVARARSLPIRP